MKKLTIMSILVLLLAILLLADDNSNQDAEKLNDESSTVLPDEYFIEKSYSYMEKHKDIYRTDNPRRDYPLDKVEKSLANNIHVFLHHYINGVRVEHANVIFGYRSNGKCFRRDGTVFFEAQKVDTDASISKEQAENIALNAVELPRPDSPPPYVSKSELIIDKVEDEFKLIWHLYVGFGQSPIYGIPHTVIIDAHTGEILSDRVEIIK